MKEDEITDELVGDDDVMVLLEALVDGVGHVGVVDDDDLLSGGDFVDDVS